MENSYSVLGRWFEKLNADCDYDEWSQYLIKRLKDFGAGEKGVDIGCGNGYFTRALIKAGYSVKGIDVSPECLDTAQRLALKEGIRTEFLLGDITELELSSKCDFAVAINDCLNYVPKDKLLKTFKNVRKCLKAGGVFIFDISSCYKLREILGNNLFAEDDENLTYIWFNTLYPDRVEMDLTFFEKKSNGLFERFDESQTKYIHEEEDIIKALRAAGFEVTTEGHLGKDKKERINFICKAV